MKTNATIIPGLNEPTPMGINPMAQGNFPMAQQTFSPQSTVIPGVGVPPLGSPVQSFAPSSGQGQIFGFLFSVSKTMAGEYWPLMLGANTLGRGLSNSIFLGEATVSDNHASIHVISRANKLIVYIKDDQSKTGTLLNGELLRGEADLKHGDIITIGERYELYVMLVNAVDLGLAVNPDFVAVGSSPVATNFPQAPSFPFGAPGATARKPKVSSSATVVEGSSGPAPVGGHTVIMGGPVK